ncbi:glycosyltransferase family 4 protein [Sulfitobacter guttiformis]|nr:glycosyltransferase family 4 protein [Sulfitobacter guttiformis]KIN71179.1 Glycosyltransferase, group 1 [Sulfitobacter guttiformis KCTC 32187]
MARALIAALGHLGAEVDLAATLRSRDGVGDDARQMRLVEEANALIPTIVTQGRAAKWQAWVTYHSYYKAPDLIGPSVARTLGIPYLLIEATRARKRLGGPWDRFAQAAEAACDAADLIFYVTQRDLEALSAYAPAEQQLVHLHPFLPRMELPARSTGTHLLAVGMMRAAAKLPSYLLIAETLALLPDTTKLEIAGDGPARPQVIAAMAPFGDRVRFLGELEAAALDEAYRRAGALIWPGVDEAFGITYLEAQAHGLPVIAQDRDGVRDVLFPQAYPSVESGAAGLAELARTKPPSRQRIRTHITAHHLLPAAADTLRAGLALVGAA